MTMSHCCFSARFSARAALTSPLLHEHTHTFIVHIQRHPQVVLHFPFGCVYATARIASKFLFTHVQRQRDRQNVHACEHPSRILSNKLSIKVDIHTVPFSSVMSGPCLTKRSLQTMKKKKETRRVMKREKNKGEKTMINDSKTALRALARVRKCQEFTHDGKTVISFIFSCHAQRTTHLAEVWSGKRRTICERKNDCVNEREWNLLTV